MKTQVYPFIGPEGDFTIFTNYPVWLIVCCFAASIVQSAVGWDYQAQLAKHESQTDATKGFGGRYGVQKERQDKVRN